MGRKRLQLRLRVFLNGELVGLLNRSTSGGLEFRYDAGWLDSDTSLPISWSLPLDETPYRGDKVSAFFDNLLPDDVRIRRLIAQRLAVNGSEPFDLLAALGRDCAGALRFVPEDVALEWSPAVEGELLTQTRIAAMLRNLRTAPLGMEPDREFRISIAGAQEKTALLQRRGRWYLPRGTTPTTHILKPPIGLLPGGIDMSASVENEWVCSKLVEYFGVPISRAQIAEFDGFRCLVVERFDRRWTDQGQHLLRVPQEDLCQALGCPPHRKYQSDGGPGIREIMGLLNSSDVRDQDRDTFMRAQIVSFLLGATDGHAKNFSIFLSRTGFRLTPLYDVMTVYPALAAREIQPKEAKLSMSVGDSRHYRLRDVQRRHWDQTAKSCGYPGIGQIMDDLVQRAGKVADFLETLPVNKRLLETVGTGIRQAARTLAR